MSDKKVILVMLGPPGAGKGTQAKTLAEILHVPQISTGDIFREHISNGTKLGEQVKSYTDRGELVPDDLVFEVVKSRLEEDDCSKGYILDGFPRTVKQAELLDSYLSSKGDSLTAVIDIDVPDEEIVKRLTGRRICKSCGAIYNIYFNPPKVEGVCDVCGGELYQREDDNEETVRNRLRVYREQTLPLVEYYEGKGILKKVDGRGDGREVLRRVKDALGVVNV